MNERDWDRADGHNEEQIKRASEKMGFPGGVNLFFHKPALGDSR
jgi:hypothetical protein